MSRPGMDLSAFTQKLIAFDTTNPPGDQFHCVEWMAAFLSDQGLKTEIRTVEGVPSLLATADFGTGGRNICWVGHWDVVPPGPLDAWSVTPPFKPEIRDGILYGRGACDMKSGVAAAVYAVLDLMRNPPRDGRVVLAILGDEENGGIRGAAQIIPDLHRETPFHYGIVGEPTNFELKIARRGVCWGKITFKGVQAHAARPDEGDNPISKMARGITALDAQVFSRQQNAGLCGKTTMSVTTAHSGDKDNTIPNAAEIGFDIRVLPEQTEGSIREDIHHAMAKAGLKKTVDYALNLSWYAGAYATTDTGMVEICRDVIESVTGERPKLNGDGGTSDGRFLAYAGVPVVEYGLENSTLHKINECCAVVNLDKIRTVYAALFRRLLGR